MPQFHKKSKKPYFGAILGTFCPNFSAKFPNFPVFKYSNYLLLCKKSEQTNDHPWVKCQAEGLMERETDRNTDRQTDQQKTTIL